MLRGEIRWFEPGFARAGEAGGRRPVLVVSRDAISRASPVVIVVPLAAYSGQTLYPSDVLIRAPEGGIARDSVAMGLLMRAVDRDRLGRWVGQVGRETMERVEHAILKALDI